MPRFIQQQKIYWVFFAIALLYFCFPTNNSTLDAYAYAAYVKYNYYMFTPHHLLGNALIYILAKPLQWLGLNTDILRFSKGVNSMFQLLNLLIFYKILSLIQLKKAQKIMLVLLLAFSFSPWRYGTENETYILPITFSLLGSWFWLKNIYYNKQHYILLAGLSAALACLFHQIHFFWWLGIGIGVYLSRKQFKSVSLYVLPALLVPLSYILVLRFYEHQELSWYNLQHFVFHDFYQGNVDTNYSWKSLFFQVVSTVRTFVQVHPNIYFLIKTNVIYILPLALALIWLTSMLWHIRKGIKIKRTDYSVPKAFVNIHLLILLLNYLFALFSQGNVEFMVMIPFLIALYVGVRFEIHQKYLVQIIGLLLVWNFMYAILPNHIYNYYNDKVFVDYMIAHPEHTYVVKNMPAYNQYAYMTGKDQACNIIIFSKLSVEDFQKLLEEEKEIYTDCIAKPEILNRDKIMTAKQGIDFKSLQTQALFSYTGFYGTSTVYRLTK